MAPGRVALAEDGVVVDLVDSSHHHRARTRRLRIRRRAVRRRRRRVHAVRNVWSSARGGFIAITVAVDPETGRWVSPPEISGRGFSTIRPRSGTPPISSAGPWTPCMPKGHRHPSHRPDHPSDRRPLGVGEVPSPPDDRAHGSVRAGQLTALNPRTGPGITKYCDAGACSGLRRAFARCRRSSFPVDVLGRAPTTSTSRGYLRAARRARQNSIGDPPP